MKITLAMAFAAASALWLGGPGGGETLRSALTNERVEESTLAAAAASRALVAGLSAVVDGQLEPAVIEARESTRE